MTLHFFRRKSRWERPLPSGLFQRVHCRPVGDLGNPAHPGGQCRPHPSPPPLGRAYCPIVDQFF